MNLFVAKLSPTTTSEDLNDLFAEYGEVDSAKVIFDRETGNSRGFGFVEMSDDEAANRAIAELNEVEFDGRDIVVKKARPREEGGQRRSNYGGGGGYNSRY